NADYKAEGCLVATSIEQAIELAEQSDMGQKSGELMVCGGRSVYEQFLPLARRMYLTFIDADFEGEVFFPQYDEGQWQEVSKVFRPADGPNPYDLSFVVLQRLTKS
ncbi:MAG: dihydrofolate reductase, partial [Candidatus Pacebacteria bacterium]|nr:dihydrofolate reductase [Candidatus Paceibacterota bacterium]